MKKLILLITFFIFMFYLGINIREYREEQKITIVEYSFYSEKGEDNRIYLNYRDIKDDKLKKIVKKNKEKCDFNDDGTPKCVIKAKENNISYNKYYIVYYGNDSSNYKIIYKFDEIKYLENLIG